MITLALIWLARAGTAVAVTASLVAAFAPKGDALHVRAGTVAERAVLGLAAVLVPLLVLAGDLVFAVMLALAAYLAFAGRRALARTGPPTIADWAAVGGLALGGVGVLSASVASTRAAGVSGWTVFGVGLGACLVALALGELRRLRTTPAAGFERHAFHAGAMGSAALLVATLGSVLFLSGPDGPSLLTWAAPAALALPALARWVSAARAHGPDARFLPGPRRGG